jgi:hypothetical protein
MSEKLVGHIKEKIEKEPGFQKIEDSYFTNRVYCFSKEGQCTSPIIIPFMVEYTRKAKGSGNIRTYKHKTSIKPSFCPFCGIAYDSI